MILITGSTGYIGSHISQYFDQRKINYIGIDNNTYSNRTNVQKKESHHKIDINEIKKIDKLVDKYKINTIIHAAASSYVLEGEINKKKYFLNNVIKTKKFINFCKNKKIDNFIFLSSSNVYKELKSHQKLSENSKLLSKNYYGKTKVLIENYLKKKKFKKLVILRLFNIIGIHNKNFKYFNFKNNIYQRLVFQVQDKIKKNKFLKIRYSIKNNKKLFPSRDFIDVKIICYTIHKIIKNLNIDKSKKIILNIGSGISTPIDQLIEKIKKNSNKKLMLKYEKINKKELMSTKANVSKLKKFLKKNYSFNLNKSIKSHFVKI